MIGEHIFHKHRIQRQKSGNWSKRVQYGKKEKNEKNQCPLGFFLCEVVPDGCAICGVAKTECKQQELHFGKKGESPPESRCPVCRLGFGNKYGASREMLLHVKLWHKQEE